MADITQQRLHELFEYDNGAFISNETKQKKFGTPITPIHRYRRLVIDGKAYAIHMLVYLYHYGYMPKVIDHIDNDRSNNCIENLRSVTQQQNCINRVKHSNNKSGHKNVHWSRAMNKWCVAMSVDGFRLTIGHYDDIEFAALVAEEARYKYHGHFARS